MVRAKRKRSFGYSASLGERLAREEGTILKDWGGRLPIALVYANSYYLGMSSLGLQAIYALLNSYDSIVCERVFFEPGSWKGGTLPVSVESGRPLTDFAAVAFTLSYELDYFNVTRTLRAAGIPLRAAQRDGRHPLIMGGGPCLTANPAPLAAFFDLIGIGEAEAILPALLPVLEDGVAGGRELLLEELARLPGVYVPALSPGPVRRQFLTDLDDLPATSAVLTRDTELGDLFLMEVERGCPRGCRFCLVGTCFSPVRYRSATGILQSAQAGQRFRKRVGLVGPSVAEHPQIEEIVDGLGRLGMPFAVSSLRIKPLPRTLLTGLASGGARTLAMAPESASARLRQLIGKNLEEADILEAVAHAADHGMKKLKLYFMIGLPTETDGDILETVDLALKLKAAADSYGQGTRLALNVSAFVPKAGTPFQWLPMAAVDTLKRRLSLLKEALPQRGIELKHDSPAWAEIQAVLSRGDKSVGAVLAAIDVPSLAGWRQAVTTAGLDVAFFAHEEWPQTQALPWKAVNSGMSIERLTRELDTALGGK